MINNTVKRSLPLFSVLLLLTLSQGSLAVRAASDGTTFTIGLRNDWALGACKTLRKAGIDVQNARPHGGRQSETRQMFAAGLAPFVDAVNLQGGTAAGVNDARQHNVSSKLAGKPKAIQAMICLVIGFEPELETLGCDTQRCLGILNGMNPRAVRGCSPEVPEIDVAYRDVDTLEKAGVVVTYSGEPESGLRIRSRLIFAEEVARLLPLLDTNVGDGPTSPKEAQAISQLQMQIDVNDAAVSALQELIGEFRPELLLMGQDVNVALARLAAVQARISAVLGERLHSTTGNTFSVGPGRF